MATLAGLPIKVLKGPRQCGKTSFLERMGSHQLVYLDDTSVRRRAQDDPRLFLDSFSGPLVLDEAASAPALFPELKRRVDEQRRAARAGDATPALDVWVTGSNQTLLRKEVRESLAGRATYLDFNTLSAHELGDAFSVSSYLLKGGWPELYVNPTLPYVRYLNDLIATFVERDIISAAGIEKKAAFTKVLQLAAGRVGQLLNASELGGAAGVELTTVQSWIALLEENSVLLRLQPYFTSLNKRLTKTPKLFFLDTGLATRLQGWTELQPLLSSPLAGHLFENMVVGEVARCFLNKGFAPSLSFARSKERVEVDLLVHLPNQRTVAIEIKTSPQDFSEQQLALLAALDLTIVERWVVAQSKRSGLRHAKVLLIEELWDALDAIL